MLDWLVLLLAGLSLFIARTGGFLIVLAGVRLSARGAWRPALMALALALLRVFLAPRVPFLSSRLEDWRRRLHRVYQPAADEVRGSVSWRGSVAAAAGMCVVAAVLLFP